VGYLWKISFFRRAPSLKKNGSGFGQGKNIRLQAKHDD
jgi:hypothetical protein